MVVKGDVSLRWSCNLKTMHQGVHLGTLAIGTVFMHELVG